MKEGDYVKCIDADYGLHEGEIYKVTRLKLGSGDDLIEVVDGKGYRNDMLRPQRFEPVKVAVHCKTEDEWNRVCENHSCTADFSGEHGVGSEAKEVGLRVDVKTGGWGSLVYFKNNNYHIISAQEYLKEELTAATTGDEITIIINNIKGEDKMKINNSIRTVFVEEDKDDFELVEKMQDVFGTEISEDFTGVLILRAYKEKYVTEIERRDAEKAKAEKEAEKD